MRNIKEDRKARERARKIQAAESDAAIARFVESYIANGPRVPRLCPTCSKPIEASREPYCCAPCRNAAAPAPSKAWADDKGPGKSDDWNVFR